MKHPPRTSSSSIKATGGVTLAEVLGQVALWFVSIAWICFVNAVDHWGANEVLVALSGQTAAAWVQAIGAIGALWFSLGLWRWDRRRIREEAITSAHVLMSRVIARIDSIYTACHHRTIADIHNYVEELSYLADFGKSQPLNMLPEEAQWEFFSAMNVCQETVRFVRAFLETRGTRPVRDLVGPIQNLRYRANAAGLGFAKATGDHVHKRSLFGQANWRLNPWSGSRPDTSI